MASIAAVEALPNIFTTSTMTPFLYHTRTLASPLWAKGRSIAQPQLREARRYFTGSVAGQVHAIQGETTTTTTKPKEGQNVPNIRRTTVTRGSEPRFSGDFYGNNTASRRVAGKPEKDPFTIMRSVYVPGAIKRQPEMPWDSTEVMDNGFEDIHSSDPYSTMDDLLGDENEMDAWTRRSNPSQERQTTITPSERAAFEAIFNTIRNKTKNAQRYGDDFDDFNNLDDLDKAKKRMSAKEKLNNIMSGAMTERYPRTRDEKETVVSRYPPSLRALAAKAVGLDYDAAHFEETAKREEEAMDNDQLEELRKPIREEVEAKMHAAGTDADLWAVMEDEVFPLIEKLGLEKHGKEKPLKKRAQGKKPATSSTVSENNIILPPEEQQTVQLEPIIHKRQEISPLAFYGPLYPSYLLLGLRLLDRSFAKPSLLTLSILPKIKSLGLISHVLGASTQLYNELLIIHWYRYDDFRGALSLLSEMEESGLSFNRETLEIVDDIIRMQGRIWKGERGATLKALWSLPEFAPGKFRYWRNKITRMLDEKRDSPDQQSSY